MRMGAGEYRFIVSGQLRSCDHWDQIPEVIEELIAFKPEIPPEPHTDAEHDLIDALPAKLREVMARCRR